jgi:hypothetical protein
MILRDPADPIDFFNLARRPGSPPLAEPQRGAVGARIYHLMPLRPPCLDLAGRSTRAGLRPVDGERRQGGTRC